MPWLVLAGSGGLANLVCDVVENVQCASTAGAEKEEGAPNMELRERLAEKVKKYFPAEQGMDNLVDKVNVKLFIRSYNIKVLKQFFF